MINGWTLVLRKITLNCFLVVICVGVSSDFGAVVGRRRFINRHWKMCVGDLQLYLCRCADVVSTSCWPCAAGFDLGAEERIEWKF